MPAAVVPETTGLHDTPAAFAAPTRNSWAVLAASPVTLAIEASAAAIVNRVHGAPARASRYSTRKPVSSDALSRQVSEADRAAIAAARFVGAAGAPKGPTETTWLGVDRPFAECFANTRKA